MTRRFQFVLTIVALTSPAALAGPQWVESGDAGKTLATAQVISSGAVMLQQISGELTGVTRGDDPDLADMYVFNITQPMAFQATTDTSAGGFAEFDADLWLFRIVNGTPDRALGLLGTRSAQTGGTEGARLGHAATDSTGVMILTPGTYALAISGGDHVPVSGGGPIFTIATPNEVSGPDGPGGSQPQTDFNGPGQSGLYRIVLNGSAPIAPSAVPAVSDVGLVILAMLVLCAGTLIFRRQPKAAE